MNLTFEGDDSLLWLLLITLHKYCILVFVRSEKVLRFPRISYFVTMKVFRQNFSFLCSNLAIYIGRIFCNCEYFSGNEGEDLQPRNFFTTNKKQYTYGKPACTWYNYSGMMFSCVLYYIVNFKIYSLGQIAFTVFSSVICYHTAALPCKRVVIMRL